MKRLTLLAAALTPSSLEKSPESAGSVQGGRCKESYLTRDLKWSRNGIIHFKSASGGTIFNVSSVIGMETIKCVHVYMVK